MRVVLEPGRRRGHDQCKRSRCLSLVEVARLTEAIGDIGQAKNSLLACFCEGVESRRFHLDCQETPGAGGRNRLLGLAERSVRGPGTADHYRQSGYLESGQNLGKQSDIDAYLFLRRKIVSAGPFVPKRTINQNEIGRRADVSNLASRAYAYEETATGGEHELRNHDCIGRSNNASHEAEAEAFGRLERDEAGMIAGPVLHLDGPAVSYRVSHKIAIRIEHAHRRQLSRRQESLPACLPEHVFRQEQRRCAGIVAMGVRRCIHFAVGARIDF